MRAFISRILITIIGLTTAPLTLLAAETQTGATATQKIHHFTIIAPATAKIGEAIDVTVEAKDKDDKVMTGYRGSIFFNVETDFGATLPAQGRAIQFKESDNGVLKLSKGVVFKRVGKQELTVTEVVEDVGGSITILVEDIGGTLPVTPSESVVFTFPEKSATVATDSIVVSGKTKKNSNVQIKLNGVDAGTTKTDNDGVFSYKISNITQQSNILSASLLDGANAVIGSTETQFNFAGKTPTYYNTSITPGLSVETGTGIVIMVDAEPGLSEVTLSIDGATLSTKETTPGKYSVSTLSPTRAGTYPVSVTLKNILSQTTVKNDAATLSVVLPVLPSAPKAAFRNVVVMMDGTKVNLNFSVDNLPTTATQFKIAYGDSADALGNEVMTYTLDKITKPNGTYNWYIPGLVQKSYTFKIFGIDGSGAVMSDVTSDPVSLTVGAQGACTIGNVTSLRAETLADKTILSWDALSGAISYNIYRINASKDLELVKNVTANTYTIDLSPGAVTYADFAVKALCDAEIESSVPAMASRVQTGPNFLAFLVLIAALGSVLLLRRKMY